MADLTIQEMEFLDTLRKVMPILEQERKLVATQSLEQKRTEVSARITAEKARGYSDVTDNTTGERWRVYQDGRREAL